MSLFGVEAKFGKLGDEPLRLHVLWAAIKMVGAEVLERRAVFEHVVDRGRDRTNCLFRATASREAVELSMEVATLIARSGKGTLAQQSLEPWIAFLQSGGSPLAGAFIVARTIALPTTADVRQSGTGSCQHRSPTG
jgi:hypothetical protein